MQIYRNMDTIFSVMGSFGRKTDTPSVDGERSRESTAPRRDKRNSIANILNADDEVCDFPRLCMHFQILSRLLSPLLSWRFLWLTIYHLLLASVGAQKEPPQTG